MNYRQWKKNYKKQHGHNPSLWFDKRKKSKILGRTMNKINNAFYNIGEAAHKVAYHLSIIDWASIRSALNDYRMYEEAMTMKQKGDNNE